MGRIRRNPTLLALLVTTALLGAACSGMAGDASTTTSSETTTSTTVSLAEGIAVGLGGSVVLTSFAFNYDETVPISREEIFTTQSFGFYQAPDRLDCTVIQGIVGPGRNEVVGTITTRTIGQQLWVDRGDGWVEVPATDPEGNFAREFCSNAWSARIDVAPDPDFGRPFVLNGMDVRYADLAAEGVPLTGREDDVVFQKFEVWMAEEGFWPVAFDTEAIGPAPEMAARIGRTYDGDPADGALVTTRGALSRINDPEIAVPEPEG